MHRACLTAYTGGVWKLNGQFWEAPVVMVTEGVMAGSDGPMFWSADVIKRMTRKWAGTPVVVGHPMSNGKPISVKHVPEQIVGHVANPVFDPASKSLKAVIKVPQGFTGINQLMMLKEVSIGVFVDSIISNGQHQGVNYIGKTMVGIPDHLAVLPEGQVGACSWAEHGCGIRTHKGEQFMNYANEGHYPLLVYEDEQDDLAILANWDNCNDPNMLPPPEITALRLKHAASRQGKQSSGHQEHAMYPPGVE